jgi:DNA-binding GntR family transcriptional regulator
VPLHLIHVMDITSSERLLKTRKQHLTILRPIKNGDVEAAKDALRKNIACGHGRVQSALQATQKKQVPEEPLVITLNG